MPPAHSAGDGAGVSGTPPVPMWIPISWLRRPRSAPVKHLPNWCRSNPGPRSPVLTRPVQAGHPVQLFIAGRVTPSKFSNCLKGCTAVAMEQPYCPPIHPHHYSRSYGAAQLQSAGLLNAREQRQENLTFFLGDFGSSHRRPFGSGALRPQVLGIRRVSVRESQSKSGSDAVSARREERTRSNLETKR